MSRYTPRKPDTELSAECRHRLAEVLSAHADDSVTLAEFAVIGQTFTAWIASRPEGERLEAASQIAEVTLPNLIGYPSLVVVGWLMP